MENMKNESTDKSSLCENIQDKDKCDLESTSMVCDNIATQTLIYNINENYTDENNTNKLYMSSYFDPNTTISTNPQNVDNIDKSNLFVQANSSEIKNSQNTYHNSTVSSNCKQISQPHSNVIRPVAPSFSSPSNVSLPFIIDSRLCRDYVRGVCRRGVSCKFIHKTDITSADSVNFGNTSVGMDRMATNNPIEINYQKLQSSLICRDFQNGMCLRGETCKFYHFTVQEVSSGKKGNDSRNHMMVLATASSKDTSPGNLSYIISGDNTFVANEAGHQYLHLASDHLAHNTSVGSDNEITTRAIPICRDYMKGKCDRGFKCRFRHITMADYYGQQQLLGRNTVTSSLGSNVSIPLKAPGNHMMAANFAVNHPSPVSASNLTAGILNVNTSMQPQLGAFLQSLANSETTTGELIEAATMDSACDLLYTAGAFHVSPLPPTAVVVSASSGASLLISRQPTRNSPIALHQYTSIPLSIVQQQHQQQLQQSSCCPLTYVTPASATINIIDPLMDSGQTPLTKRRLYQPTPIGAASIIDVESLNTISSISNLLNNHKNQYHNSGNEKLTLHQASFKNNNFSLTSGNENTITENHGKTINHAFNNSNPTNEDSVGINERDINLNRHANKDGASTKTLGSGNSGGILSHTEKALVEENESLKQRLDTLKKQIAELNATVDMLLEQNRRLRLCGMGGGIVVPPSGNNTGNHLLQQQLQHGHMTAGTVVTGAAAVMCPMSNNSTSMHAIVQAPPMGATVAPLTLLAAAPAPQLPLVTPPSPQSTFMVTPSHSFHSPHMSAFNSFNVVSAGQVLPPTYLQHPNNDPSVSSVGCQQLIPSAFQIAHHSTPTYYQINTASPATYVSHGGILPLSAHQQQQLVIANVSNSTQAPLAYSTSSGGSHKPVITTSTIITTLCDKFSSAPKQASNSFSNIHEGVSQANEIVVSKLSPDLSITLIPPPSSPSTQGVPLN